MRHSDFTRIYFLQLLYCLQIASLCFSLRMKKIYNWKQKEAALVASRITENWSLATPTKPPSPTALEVVILTTPSKDNDEIKSKRWHICFSDYPSRFYITHRCFLSMTYITVWDGAVNTIYIQIILFYGGRESVDTIGSYFLENVQWCAIYQDR